MSFVALLTRPEVLILFVIVTAARAAVALRGDRRQLRAIAEDVLAFGFVIALLQAWRWSHFRAWVPNPAYLKTAPSGLTSPRGVESITTFFETNWSLLLAGAVGAAVVVATPALRRFRVSVLTSWLFVLAYIAFYARVDTLMDISGRFLFPLVPVLVWQAAVAGSWWLANAPRLPQRALGAGLVFLGLLGFTAELPQRWAHAERQLREGAERPKRTLMQREYEVAKSLAGFPRVEKLRIAFGDAGVIPYFTGAEWLDTVGLNDRFIARERDLGKLVDYFFSWNADLVIQAGSKKFTYMRNGHGPLGDDSRWARDPRWDRYEYVGTTRTDGRTYDLHFFVRDDSPFRRDLGDHLRSDVVDGWYDPLPLRWGTDAAEGKRTATRAARKKWSPVPSG